ncbi:MAG: hypothetical protein N4A50_05165 [Vallitalea sp.]|nr:hypothetical protein [Vallitalea sp.]
MEYKINMYSDGNDPFERESDNVGVLQVYDKDGNNISSSVKVQLFLNKNAMIGLGTELIRMANNSFRKYNHTHLEPAQKDFLCQRMGIFLTPDSSELIISCDELGIIDDYLNEE